MNPPTMILTTFLLLLLHVSTSSLLHQTCRNSSTSDPNIHYSFCVAALQSAPTARCAALPRLALLSLRLLQDNATDTRCLVKTFLNDKTTPYAFKAPLEDCLDLYSDSVATLKEAVADFKGGKYFDAKIKVTSVMDAAVTCEDGFQDVGVASPITRSNGFAFQLGSISLSIVNSLPIRG